jgi:hypothetical protein
MIWHTKVRPLDENENPVLLGAEVRVFEAGTRNQVKGAMRHTLAAGDRQTNPATRALGAGTRRPCKRHAAVRSRSVPHRTRATQVGGGRHVIDGGSGFGSQNFYDAFFGLGDAVDRGITFFDVEVLCPHGIWLTKHSNSDLGNVSPEQLLTAVCANTTSNVTVARQTVVHSESLH